jgi:hypothetical protein
MAKRKQTAAKEEPRWQPDASYVMGLYRQRLQDGDEVKLRQQIATMRQLVEMEHPLQIPDQYRAITKEVRTPFARDSWQRVTAALTQHPPVAHVEPREEREEAKHSANLAERWTMAALEAMNEECNEDIIYEATKHLVRDGQSIIKVVHWPDAWASFPERGEDEEPEEYEKRAQNFKKQSRLPFAWRVVDRLSCLPGEGEFGPVDMVEYGEYPLLDMGRRYGMIRDRDGRLRNPANLRLGIPKPEGELVASSGRVIKLEYWDEDWWHVVIDGEDAPGFPKQNPYGCLPYFRARVHDHVLMALRYLVPALDELLTMKMNWAYVGAYPTPTLEPVPNTQQLPGDLPGGEDATAPALVWKPGKMMQLPMGYRFGFVSPPPVGQDLNQMVQSLRDFIDVAGIPSVFRGVGGADQAGYAINQLIAAAVLTYRVLTMAAQGQLRGVGKFLWRVVERRIKQPVYVQEAYQVDSNGRRKDLASKNWLCLAPDGKGGRNAARIELLGKLTYSFRPVLPTDEQARAMIASQLVNAPVPLYDPETALEKWLQEEDPQKILDRIWVNKKLNETPLDELTVQAAMRRAGVLQPNTPNPAANLVSPTGEPLLQQLGGGGTASPYLPGQVSAGMPAIPGLNQPVQPETPGTPAILAGTGGRPAGAYPGRPGGVPAGSKVTGI